jgi:hypothetical protein
MPRKLNPEFLRTRILADLLAQAKRKNINPLPKTTIPLRKALLQLDYADDQDYIGAGPGNPTTFSRFIVGGPQQVAQQQVVLPKVGQQPGQVVAVPARGQQVAQQIVQQQRKQQVVLPKVGQQIVQQQRKQQVVLPKVGQQVAQQRKQQVVLPKVGQQIVQQQRKQQVVGPVGRKPKWLTKAFFRNKSPQELREQCKRLNIVAKTKAEMVDALFNYTEYKNGQQFGGAKVVQAVVQQGGAKVAQAVVQQGGGVAKQIQQPKQVQQPKVPQQPKVRSQEQARSQAEIIATIRKCLNE